MMLYLKNLKVLVIWKYNLDRKLSERRIFPSNSTPINLEQEKMNYYLQEKNMKQFLQLENQCQI